MECIDTDVFVVAILDPLTTNHGHTFPMAIINEFHTSFNVEPDDRGGAASSKGEVFHTAKKGLMEKASEVTALEGGIN